MRTISYSIVALIFAAIINYMFFDFLFVIEGKNKIASWQQSEAVELQQGNLLTSFSKFDRVLAYGSDIKSIALVKVAAGSKPRLLIALGDQNFSGTLNRISFDQDVVSYQLGLFDYLFVSKLQAGNATFLVGRFKSQSYPTLFLINVILITALIGMAFFWNTRLRKLEENERHKIFIGTIDEMLVAPGSEELVETIKQENASSSEVRDVLLRLHKQLLEKDRSEARSTLARQVAHDIRSPLTSLNMIADSLPAPTQSILLLKQSVKRIADITQDLLDSSQELKSQAISGKGSDQVSLKSLIEQLAAEKQSYLSVRTNVKLELDLPADDLQVRFHDREISRVLSNLVDNSVEAISVQGVIKISLRIYKEKVLIVVSDNGKGMSADILARLGEKDFTTGKAGHGIGVHYAMATVKQLNGSISFSSQVGIGTMVQIAFPTSGSTTLFA